MAGFAGDRGVLALTLGLGHRLMTDGTCLVASVTKRMFAVVIQRPGAEVAIAAEI